MAEYEQKDMTGSLFHNDKGDNQKRPDMRGTVKINGTKYSVSGWNNESEAGKKYLSLKIQEFTEKPMGNGNTQKPAQQTLVDEIPF